MPGISSRPPCAATSQLEERGIRPVPSPLCHAGGTRLCPAAAGAGVLWPCQLSCVHVGQLLGLGPALGMGGQRAGGL